MMALRANERMRSEVAVDGWNFEFSVVVVDYLFGNRVRTPSDHAHISLTLEL